MFAITSGLYPWFVQSSIDCFQIRSVSKNRLIKRIGVITFQEIAQVQIYYPELNPLQKKIFEALSIDPKIMTG